MAFHPLGTCRMGPSAADGVVDGENRVFGTENLYVVDGASVPSSLGVNPQVTIMAMALRAAEGLEARLAGRSRPRTAGSWSWSSRKRGGRPSLWRCWAMP